MLNMAVRLDLGRCNMGVQITTSGPIFDGTADRVIGVFLEVASQSVAKEGVNRIQARLGQVLKHPTGHYRSQITTDTRESNSIITDSGVVYGPWLEGVGSRNQSTKFKGYSTFRKVCQELNNDVESIIQKDVDRLVERLNS
jgi:hypothetical protein